MKTCPVCNTSVFDDMKACYGCMHRFDEETPPGTFEAASPLTPEPPIDEPLAPTSLFDQGRFGQANATGSHRSYTGQEADEHARAFDRSPLPPMAMDSDLEPARWNEDNDIALRAQHSPLARERASALDADPMLKESGDGRWKVRLEVRVASSPAQVWSAEFSPSVFTPVESLAAQDCTVS